MNVKNVSVFPTEACQNLLKNSSLLNQAILIQK